MAYSLRSLVQTLEQILHPHQHHKKWVLDPEYRPQIHSLSKNAIFLRNFLDESSPLVQERIATLEDQIMDAAKKTEDILESHITSQILLSPRDQSFTICPPDVGEMIQALEVAKQEVIKIMDEGQRSEYILTNRVTSTRYQNSETVVVGVSEDLILLNNRLTAGASELDIIPIVGMGGTGKTTLARILYNKYSSSKSHFDCCAWATFSQNYDPQLVLRTLIACVTGTSLDKMPMIDKSSLILSLFQTLFSRRYLIVFDDIWSCNAWDDVQTAFPRDYQGSRIIFTTRDTSVANYVNLNSHQMRLLNEEDSWELIKKKVFGEDTSPGELEEVGKRIARNCTGLPLALQVISGFLSHSDISKDDWDHVEHNVSSVIAKADDHFSGIFSWSFAHLPHYLKPCFLYMGAFPEDSNIPASMVIQMWVVEGFLYPIPGKSLEEAAEIHLNSLVERNLIFVRKRKSNGKVRYYGMHDLLRDLCLNKGEEKKFIYFVDSTTNNLQVDPIHIDRVSILTSDYSVDMRFISLKLTPHARSFQVNGFVSDEEAYKIMHCLCQGSSLLRVLDVTYVKISQFIELILQLVNLRYLAIRNNYDVLPRSISVLKNLRTLIVYAIESIAVLVDMPLLRHLQFYFLKEIAYEGPFTVHENLQRLSKIPLVTLTNYLGKLTNVRMLGIDCRDLGSYDTAVDLKCFDKLDSLKFDCSNAQARCTLMFEIIFPESLRKMYIDCCEISKALLDSIGMLPNLQILKISRSEFKSPNWEPCEGGFHELRYLEIHNSNLKNWIADDTHFPVLRHLALQHCLDMKEIPIEIGDINTLETIEVDYCQSSVFDSAKNILEEQLQFDNTLFQLRLGTVYDTPRTDG